MTPEEIATLAGAARRAEPKPLRCPCGGAVELGGQPAPTYTCKACGRVAHTLAGLERGEPKR